MATSTRNKLKATACGAVIALAFASSSAWAEEGANDLVSGSAAVSFNSHFISYGADVWGGGDDFFGSQSTMFMTSDLTFDLSPFSLTFGVWGDVNNNLTSGTGGGIQEVDVWAGIGVDVGRFNFSFTFQQWYYASDTEGVIDLGISFDDSDLLPIALNPSLTWHFRIEGNGAQQKGSAIVLGIAPSFTLVEDDTYPISLTVPVGVAFFLDKDFQGGFKSGYGYSYFGLSLGVPLGFIPKSYGEWAVNFDVTFYDTRWAAIPNNPESGFFTGSFGLSVAY